MLIWLLWLAGFALFAIAALSVWRALTNPVFYGQAIVFAFNSLAPIVLKRMATDDEKSWREMMRRSPDNETIRAWHEARRRRLRGERED